MTLQAGVLHSFYRLCIFVSHVELSSFDSFCDIGFKVALTRVKAFVSTKTVFFCESLICRRVTSFALEPRFEPRANFEQKKTKELL